MRRKNTTEIEAASPGSGNVQLADSLTFVVAVLSLLVTPGSFSWVWVLDMDVTSLSYHFLPNSQLSVGLKYEAQAVLKVRT